LELASSDRHSTANSSGAVIQPFVCSISFSSSVRLFLTCLTTASLSHSGRLLRTGSISMNLFISSSFPKWATSGFNSKLSSKTCRWLNRIRHLVRSPMRSGRKYLKRVCGRGCISQENCSGVTPGTCTAEMRRSIGAAAICNALLAGVPSSRFTKGGGSHFVSVKICTRSNL
jgi:hypothetical protein